MFFTVARIFSKHFHDGRALPRGVPWEGGFPWAHISGEGIVQLKGPRLFRKGLMKGDARSLDYGSHTKASVVVVPEALACWYMEP